jgi:hypothetical protein
MKIPKSVIEQEYEFWKLDKMDQVKVYIDYYMEHEIPDIPLYKSAPQGYVRQFREYVDKIYGILKEQYDDKNHVIVRQFSPNGIAFTLIYIASAISHVGLHQEDLRKQINQVDHKSVTTITEYLLNTVGCIDWFKQTLEYKEWEEHEKWKKENPNYFKKPDPDDPKEKAKLISLSQKKIKSPKYSQSRVLSRLKR